MPARLPRSVERYLFRDFLPRLRGDTCIRICTKLYQLGDPDHPDYGLSCRQASGFGAMVSFKVDTHKRALAVLERVRPVLFAESLGGTESLVTYPLVQTHGSIPGPMLDKLGIDERLLRLSVGLENAEDLIADLEQAIG